MHLMGEQCPPSSVHLAERRGQPLICEIASRRSYLGDLISEVSSRLHILPEERSVSSFCHSGAFARLALEAAYL